MKKFILILGIGVFLMFVSNLVFAKENKDLVKKHAKIERQFPDVDHMDANNPMLERKDDVVIFDVRERKEYDVSHLPGAIHIEPGISTAELLNKYATEIEGKTVVFYCSVGQRSSQLADQTQSTLIDEGAKDAYNLEGGIFNWHNQKKSLVSTDQTPTELVHPYNAYWGRMVNDRSKTGYKPEQ